jgi:hypothetical protein
MRPFFKDENVEQHKVFPNIRTGRFLWMDEDEKKNYLKNLRDRIEQGYFSSETIVTKIVDEIAPVLNECVNGD